MFEKDMMDIAIKAAKAGGKILMSHYKKEHHVHSKGPLEIFTEVDVLSETEIKKIIKKAFPKHGILGEEEGKTEGDSDYVWIIDPLDGTNNYQNQIDFFNVSIAVAKGNELIIGVVYDPVRDELFAAEKDKGATLNGKEIKVRQRTALNHCMLATNPASTLNKFKSVQYRRFWHKLRAPRIIGAKALELAYVACGRLDIYYNTSTFLWDVAAGILIIREAGGVVKKFDGSEWMIDDNEFIATERTLLPQILKIISRY
ncbi:inositol monophosphatase [Candidatus Woesearchaeota archaeon]|nr:inositol monophosphatase [Candidatus Woesearchaeota archaeon]MBW3018392.1 inositol monophosphatase [Candidatus Woesearchaeota archaeon]